MTAPGRRKQLSPAVGAYSIFKTNSLLGAVLFHAGCDLMIIVPVLNSA